MYSPGLNKRSLNLPQPQPHPQAQAQPPPSVEVVLAKLRRRDTPTTEQVAIVAVGGTALLCSAPEWSARSRGSARQPALCAPSQQLNTAHATGALFPYSALLPAAPRWSCHPRPQNHQPRVKQAPIAGARPDPPRTRAMDGHEGIRAHPAKRLWLLLHSWAPIAM